MVLKGATFSEDVQSRIKTYEIVTDKAISENDDLYVENIALIKIGKDRKQAIPIEGSQEPGYSAVYRNIHCPDRLISSTHPKISTFAQLFEATVTTSPKAPALGERTYNNTTKKWGPYEYQTYAEVDERAKNLASGIINIVEDKTGLNPNTEQYAVGLFGPNSRNWVVTDIACALTALTSVPLYDTLGPESTQHIINITEMPIIFASLAHIPYILSIKDKLPLLKILVSLEEFESPDHYERPGHTKRDLLTQWSAGAGVSIYSMSDLEKSGKENPSKRRVLSPDDIQTLCFTSGTTGLPKGVIITASNMVTAVCVSKYTNASFNAKGPFSYLAFLPLAHIYERVTVASLLASGGHAGFLHGDVTELFDDIATLKPTVISGVPRVWNRVASAIKTSALEAPGLAGTISRKAFAAKAAKLAQTGDYTHAFWDRIWSNKIRRKLGLEKTVALISGSAPLAAENIELMKSALALDLLQGYGLTESLSGISVCVVNDIGSGSVGPVAPTTEVRLREIPDMGYSASDKPYPRGEIMLRGPQMFKGYYKNEEETAKAFDKDGWFHTGDIGMIDECGRIYIIDRVKNMFKLAQGEYVGPERIEAVYQSASSLIGQIFVDGNSLEVFLVAIVGIAPESYVPWLKHHFNITISETDTAALEESFKRKDIRKAFNEELNRDVKNAGLKGFEMIKNLTLFIEPLTAENGILTPTLKVKRKEASSYYKDVVAAMYKEGQLIQGSSEKRMAKL